MSGDLRSQAQASGLGGNCTFVPATADVARWLREIDIFVLPSRSEAFSNSLLEAMASGCCPVATRVGGNIELVCHGDSGMLFEPGDVGQLCRVLEPLLAHPILRQRLAERARLVAERFSIAASARRMEEIYTELIEASSK